MRLHLLEATAFGPFADTVTVDFDALSEAGLFLLSGPTGAGKTSVLDAVCFALYGDVPGDRSTAKRLRCDQAPPDRACVVVLEATFGDRRFRLRRTPAWERPKKRGTGTTTQPASVVVTELVDGAWVTLSTRLDETGHLVTRLVGMNLTQFVQVALLPQGRFQAFLRARSEDRHRLLQQLFRTGRFEQVERWLRDRRVELRRASESEQRAVATLAGRVCEAAEAALPGGCDPDDLSVSAGDGTLAAWAAELVRTADQGYRDALQRESLAAEAEQAARVALEGARVLAERRQRHTEALAERSRLDAATTQRDTDRRRLEAARRAAAVAPLRDVAVRAAHHQATAADAVRRTLERVGRLLPDVDSGDFSADGLARLSRRHGDRAAQLRAAVPQQQRLADVRRGLTTTRQRRERLEEQVAELTATQADLPVRLAALRDRLAAGQTAAHALAQLQAQAQAVDGQLAARATARALVVDLAAAEEELHTARRTVTERRERWLDLREARLDGIAAELAGGLAVGGSCPVCGSAEHPHKAVPAPGAPDAEAERAAQRLLDDGNAEELARAELVRDLTTRLAVARERSGDLDDDMLQARRDQLGADVEAARAAAARTVALEAEVERAEADQRALAERLRAAAAAATEARTTLAALVDERDRIEAELAALLGEEADAPQGLEAAADRHRAAADSAEEARRCLTELRAAETRSAEARDALDAAAAAAGFDDPHHAIAALLDAREGDRLSARLAEHDRRRAAVDAVLAEADPADLERPAPDLDALSGAHDAALGDYRRAAADVARWTTRCQRLEQLGQQLTRALDSWAPLREELELTTRLCAFVEGKSADNRLQVRLSAYVLGYRLAQVVDAANLRLARMSDQRFSLEHTAHRGAGETRGGLSLQVRDDWSGESRDPATLSGGETFVVSLALALGLADVITQESDAAAEGSRLETLFVDEGFGSLDAETLDDVMDVLDSLRDGGRVVGVVSHVAEMRDRIPVQLAVSKSPRGSTVAVRR